MSIERRQAKLAQIAISQERWERSLFRAADELRKLRDQRKRLLKPKSVKGGTYQPETLDDLDDAIPEFLGFGGKGY
jgi:hypothetical protein